MPARWTDYVDLDEVQEALRNPKSHADEDIDASLGRFGYIEPGVLDERTGRLVGGHGRLHRLRAMRDRGYPPPDGIEVADGRWRLPVSRGWASRDDEDAFAAGVALNRIGEKGGWVADPLAAMLVELREGRGLEGTGYSPGDLDGLLASLKQPEPPAEFPSYDEGLPTEHTCPRCGYAFSGG